MKRETMILSAVLAVAGVALVAWIAYFGAVDGRIPGSQYVEIREVVKVYHPRDAVWIDPIPAENILGFWADPQPDPVTGEPVPRIRWDRASERWLFLERDAETGEMVVSGVWHPLANEWRVAKRVVVEDDEVVAQDDEVDEPVDPLDEEVIDPDVDLPEEIEAEEEPEAVARYIAGEQSHPTAIEPIRTWLRERGVTRHRAGEPGIRLDLTRTLGLWFAALCSLFVISFLYRDNPFYKFAESLVVGVSAAYTMVVGWWTMVVPNLIGKLWPSFVAAHILPEHEEPVHLSYLIVLVLGIMLLWRLSPKGGWIARWPLAFIIGITAGMRLIAHLESDFAIQIQASILPLVVRDDGGFSLWLSIRNSVIVLSLLACLTYFFFSIEHKGVVGRTARVGIWVLMITFGAGFAYTVMGRITLLTQRVEFLVRDWLWLIQ